MEAAIWGRAVLAELLIYQGNYFALRKMNQQAGASYAAAIEKDPDNMRSYMVAAGFYEMTGNNEKALALYTTALDRQPDDIRIKSTIASFYLKNKNLDQAGSTIDGILQERPYYFPARLLKGELLVQN